MSTDETVYVDARCLQDPMYQFRGVGHHVASLLRSRAKIGVKWRVVGLCDANLPPMPDEHKHLFDAVSPCVNYSFPSHGSIFISASPMTHDPRFSLRFGHHPNLLPVAVVYDFIPFDRHGYLPRVSDRIDYLSKLARLKSFTLFLPISRYSARRLVEMLGVNPEDVHVTGAAVRASLFQAARQLKARKNSTGPLPPANFLTVGGGDRRKNTETAVRAVRHLNLLYPDSKVRLRVVGHYGEDYKADLIGLAGGGDFLEFWPGVTDETLAALYLHSLATIAPSYIEGFSLPVVESAVCGAPVIASRCAAHMELVEQPEALFTSDSAEELAERLTPFLLDPGCRDRLVHAQAHLAGLYSENDVGGRFWEFVRERFERRFHPASAAISTGAKPKVAFLSPFPTDQSGVARFTELTLKAARSHFEIDLFTDAPRPLLLEDGMRDAGRITQYPLLKNRYDSIVSVLGNSHFHTPIFELFERYGGPCIMHDSRLTQIYFHRLGQTRFVEFAAKLLGRAVDMSEVHGWLRDEDPPSLFVEPVIERACPVIVHTTSYRELLHRRYGVEAPVATFPPNMYFGREELEETNRAAIRKSLGIANDVFMISSFGFVSRTKGVFSCIVALELLRHWNIPAELFLIGDPYHLDEELKRLALEYDVLKYFHLSGHFVPPQQYRDYMIASDAAVQLRSYDFGQPSAGLVDCISAGLPTVTGDSLGQACDAPSYVSRIPDHVSPLLLAERLAGIWERRLGRPETSRERQCYCEEHSFERYAVRLAEILAL